MSINHSEYNSLYPFKAWVQQTLPAIYDDSLSYTDLLAKMLAYINELVENNNALTTDMKNTVDYINNYFDSTDFTEKVNTKLDQMASDGTLSRLIQPLFDEYKKQIDSDIAGQNTKINSIQNQQTVLSNRMDTFTQLPSGSTTGDAELEDIRNWFNGEKSNTAGEAVRGQAKYLYDNFSVKDFNTTLDGNTVYNQSFRVLFNVNSKATNMPFNDWKDGGTWVFVSDYSKELYNNTYTGNYISELTVYDINMSKKSASKTNVVKGDGSTTMGEWVINDLSKINVKDFNTALDGNAIYKQSFRMLFNTSSNMLNMPFNDWKDGGTWVFVCDYSNFLYNDTTSNDYVCELSVYDINMSKKSASKTNVVKGDGSTIMGEWVINDLSASTSSNYETITCGVDKQFTTLRSACEYAITKPNTHVIVYPGTYDLTQEYNDHITNKNGTGISLTNGIVIQFLAGSYVKCLLDTQDGWLFYNFEPFKVNGSFELDGINLECKNTRYCVHDEMGGAGIYHSVYKNCNMKYTNEGALDTYVQCIGGGLGEHGYIQIIGGIYESVYSSHPTNPTVTISYHNGYTPTCDSKIFISGVYLKNKGYFRFGYHGSSVIKSQVELSNCSTGAPTEVRQENDEYSTSNFEVTEFNVINRNE